MNESRQPGVLRRLLPWVVGAAILVVIVTRIPFAQFQDAIERGPHLLLAVVNVGILLAVLSTDSFATWVALRSLGMPRPLARVAVVRGATYALFLVNYAVGQGGFGYYLHRTGEPALRAVGATLYLIGTNFAMLLLVTACAWGIHGGVEPVGESMSWVIAGSCAAFVIYLVVIVARPGILVRRAVLSPLFDAGLRGHALAMAARLPHVAVVILGHWVAMVVWGIPVPFVAGILIMPAVVVVSTLPISPAGLGTTQAAFVLFFQSYASGATEDERAAAVLAFAVVHFVYFIVASVVVGLICTPLARREAT